MAPSDQLPISAVVCLGYPLVGQGLKAPMRTEVLSNLASTIDHPPVLFVSGTRDSMGPIDKMQKVLADFSALKSELMIVEVRLVCLPTLGDCKLHHNTRLSARF